MKLYIDQRGGSVSGPECTLDLYTENGERIVPARMNATVEHLAGEMPVLKLEILIDGQQVVFGKPPGMAAAR